MILTARNICKTYKGPPETHVLKGIFLEVPESTSVAIMGKSGEGKSTLLHILGTLEEPSSGQILIAGEEVKPSNYPKIRSEKIGFVFQFYNLLEEETLLDNLLLPIKIRRLPTHKNSFHYARAHDLLAQVGLEERKNLSSKYLSGGEKQRAAIARALIGDPSVILADEPSGNLDSASSGLIHELLLNLTEKEKKSLVVVTHDSSLAQLCHHQYELKSGSLNILDLF
jgi:lipoprotein-releasing system ATP-binding protein